MSEFIECGQHFQRDLREVLRLDLRYIFNTDRTLMWTKIITQRWIFITVCHGKHFLRMRQWLFIFYFFDPVCRDEAKLLCSSIARIFHRFTTGLIDILVFFCWFSSHYISPIDFVYDLMSDECWSWPDLSRYIIPDIYRKENGFLIFGDIRCYFVIIKE